MTLQVDGVTMEKVLGDHAVQVGETAYAAITLKTPNDLIQMQVDGCRMKNPNGAAGMLSYDFISVLKFVSHNFYSEKNNDICFQKNETVSVIMI